MIFHNDNKTTFEFVSYVLISIFGKSVNEAITLTLQCDQNGYCIAGDNYVKDIAETKKTQVLSLARENGFPFQVSVEEM